MKVATMQEAIEGAPTLVLADGEGGATFHLITDEAILAAVKKIVELNGWNDEERQGLYEAVVNTIELVGLSEDTDE